MELQNLKVLFKAHDNDLSTIKAGYIELKTSLDTCQEADNTNSSLDENQINENIRQEEDLKNLENLIKQLSERWNTAMHLFKNRLMTHFNILKTNICFLCCCFLNKHYNYSISFRIPTEEAI